MKLVCLSNELRLFRVIKCEFREENMDKVISIIVPCYNEQEAIPLFYTAIEEVMAELYEYPIEYWFINDGSEDQTLNAMQQLQEMAPQSVHYISFSRNFGKEAAMYAGLEVATGDYVALMDVDLQDPPELLPEMIQILEAEGFDCAGTRRITRKGEPVVRSFFAKQFYYIMNKVSKTEIIDGVRDYRLMKRQMVDAILKMPEYNRFSKGIFSWIGFKTKYLEYENQDRAVGETSWSFWQLFKYSLDGIVDFSEVPLAFASLIGFLSFIISGIALVFIIIQTLIFDNPTSGWASLTSIILMVGGLQLLSLGIVGKYIGKIYLEVKNRPVYLIKEKK